MYDIFRLPKFANLVAVGLAFCLCVASFQVSAFLPSSTSSLLSPYTNPSVPNITYGSDATGKVGRDFSRSTSAGANYNRLMRSTADKAVMGAAAVKLIKSLPAVGTVLTLLDIAADLNASWRKNANGENELFTTTSSLGCAPSFPNLYGVQTGQIMCSIVGKPYPGWAVSSINVYQDSSTTCKIEFTCENGVKGGPGNHPMQLRTADSAMSDSQLADAIAHSPKFPKLLSELDPLSDALPTGDLKKLPWGTPQVVLPKPFTTTEVATKPDGSVCTKTTTNTAIESDAEPTAYNKVTAETCKVPPNTSTNPTSVTSTISTGTTTSTETPTKDFCETHPASIGCLDIDTPDLATPKTTKAISYAAENSFGGGSCPANKVMTLRGSSVTVFDWVDACSKIVSYVKPIFIMMAGFIAMLIVAGVKVES
jgi:hypothetical protein